jgi:hypothetical protein
MASGLRRRMREILKRRIGDVFEVGQRFGVDILPRHFYSSVPDMRELRRDGFWKAPRSMVGIRGADVGGQLAFAAECCPPPLRERQRKGDIYPRACEENGEAGFGPSEANFLHCFITTRRPPRVVQVGAGVSTSVILSAAKEAGYDVKVTCVDPFPTTFLQQAAKQGRLELVAEPAQKVALELLTDVGPDGFLFVDSTHTVKPGSEVPRIVLEALPRVPAGAWVHFHDINFPYDYTPGLLIQPIFFSEETALLMAYLTDNARYTVRASLSMLHYQRATELRELLPLYRPRGHDEGLMSPEADGDVPSSIYLQVVPAAAGA